MWFRTRIKTDKLTAQWPALTKVNYSKTKTKQSILKTRMQDRDSEVLEIINRIELIKITKAIIWICTVRILNSMAIRRRVLTTIWNRTRRLHRLQMALKIKVLWMHRCRLEWTSTWTVAWILILQISRCSSELVRAWTQSMSRSHNLTAEWFESKIFLKQLSTTSWTKRTSSTSELPQKSKTT